MTTASTSAAAAVPRHRIRRRRADKPAITSRLILDDHIKSDVGVLSEDVFTDLFPHLRESTLARKYLLRNGEAANLGYRC